MTLLTLLGDENAWAPSSKICAVSAKEMPHSPSPPVPYPSCSPPHPAVTVFTVLDPLPLASTSERGQKPL